MVEKLISRYKNYKKQRFLKQPERYQKHYAFVGAGGHSIDNLYPVLDFLAVPLKYIVTRSEANAERMAQRYQGASGTNELSKVLKDPAIAGVFVCTQPSAHFELAKKVLEAGKHLFIEKPPCLSLEELDELNSLSKANQVGAVVGLQKRYATVYDLLKKKIKDNIHYQFRYLTGIYP
ncbi:MAG: Gfo/Idh/MocA family oxidoreductase, partial [Bacteroidota bacterium]